ncbi:hypothetical protein K450DRAFT_299035 [Umbelopsis ramanniana AG]|uniref:EF-hand domain-containing protein n=1 Tax=Umbelopsis ramanniana AG TaxID=1314678 RepID=A0AAD5ECA8_UMBRA|nr:uncharacterized protein K450DRAFT_299035 [Umbelopsis ramanniana AG]KAI8581063.1 hypothetical protein K450DRAFT_299035 [Umbelopsis ramanniana AG]
MHHPHRSVTHYVIPRYMPMCLVLAGIIAIHLVDNFPISTIDMLLSAFSIASGRKKLANLSYPSDGPEKSLAILAPTSEECQTNFDDATLIQERIESDDNEETSIADFLGNPPVTNCVTLSLPSKPSLKPVIKPMSVLINSTTSCLASPSSPTPEISLEQRLKDIEIEDECWSPSPSLNDDNKIELPIPLKTMLKGNDLKDDKPNTTISLPASPSTPDDQQLSTISDTIRTEEKTKNKKCCELKESAIPKFYYSKGEPNAKRLACERNRERMNEVSRLFSIKKYFTEENFLSISKACQLPRYMTLALFRKIECFGGDGERVSQEEFLRFIVFLRLNIQDQSSCWSQISKDCIDDDEIMFNLLCKVDRSYMSPEDLLPVLEGLEFLADNVLFQERYIETVICRIYYENRCVSGKLPLSQFKRYNMGDLLARLERRIDLNSDHDLIVSQNDMLQYNNQVLTSRITARVMECGKIMAFPRDTQVLSDTEESTLTYMDFIWFLISEIDKTTRMSTEYWFRCMDLDGDGIISSYELSYFWEEQEKRQTLYGVCESEIICFEDVICQITRINSFETNSNDLIKPQVLGQFTLTDLRKSKLAERFFDTFINFHRLQIHESSHNSTRLKRQYLDALSGIERIEMDDQLQSRPAQGQSLEKMSDWCAYAEIEYQHLVAAERSETIWDDVGAEVESCTQLDMDGDKMLSTVERLFNGDVDFGYVENLENATQEDLEAILQRVVKTTFSSSQEYSIREELEEIHHFSSSDDEGDDHRLDGIVRRERKFQI